MINKFLNHKIYQVFFTNRIYFLWVTLASVVIGGLLLLVIPKQYSSSTLLFPARQFSPSKLIIEANAGNQPDYMVFGYRDDCDRLIDLLNSDALKVEMANVYNLWDRWKIKNNEHGFHNLTKQWDDMVSVRRTEYSSVKLEVSDYTAEGAAELVNGMIQYADTIKFRMNKPMVDYVLQVVKTEYDSTMARIKYLQDTLTSIRLAGVLHHKEMLKAFMRRYTKAVAKADIDGMRRLEAELDKLKKYGSAYEYAKDALDDYSAKYPDIHMKYDEARVNAESILPSKFVVDNAIVDGYWNKPKPVLFILNIVLLANLILLAILYNRQRVRGMIALYKK